MASMKDILQLKGQEVLTINRGETVFAALQLMAEKNVGALIVTGDEGRVAGIFTERDYARKVILKGISSLNTPLEKIMTESVCFVDPELSVDEGMALMTEKRCRHLPVLDQGELVGLVSIGDLVKAAIEDKEFIIDQLTRYIQSV